MSCSFSKLSVTSPTSQLILQPFRCFSCVTAHSPTLLSLLLHHRLFTYVTWRAAHAFTRSTLQLTYTYSIADYKPPFIHRSKSYEYDEQHSRSGYILNADIRTQNVIHAPTMASMVKRMTNFYVPARNLCYR